jgi:uncharacterized membrane protein YfcA
VNLIEALGLGLLIGISLGALGGGGSILTVPALVYVLGQPAKAATAASLVIVGITALTGCLGHARSGNVRWRSGLAFGLIGVAASYGGTALNRHVNQDVLLLAFGALMIVAALAMTLRTRSSAVPRTEAAPVMAMSAPGLAEPGGLGSDGSPMRGNPLPGDDRSPAWNTSTVTKLVAASLVVGFLTGFLGVGGGFVIVPALVMVLNFPMEIAVGTSLLIIAINSGAALAARAGNETFHWSVIIPFTAAAIIGSLIGKQVADKASGPSLTRAFAALLLGVAIYVITRSTVSLW